MANSVVRIYATHEMAEQAAAELRKKRYSADDVYLVQAGAHATDTIHAAGVPRDRAAGFAEAIPEGGAAVVVNPPFGTGALAEEVLDHFEPLQAGPSSRVHASEDFHDDATPFSRWLGWRVLLDSPQPFSDRIGWKTLTTKPYTFGKVPLSNNPAPASRMLGMPILTRTQAPVTNTKSVGTLAGKPGYLSDRLGWKMLTKNQGPVENIKLSHEAAPFSRLLGLPVLTKNQ